MSPVTRVLVVDDSAVFRKLLSHVINRDSELTVVGEAADGVEAVDLVQQLHPDVITMDMHMPRMTGAEATARIMQLEPIPIVIVSASVDPTDVAQSFRALDLGAVSIVGKPLAGPGSPEFASAVDQIVKTVKLLSRVKVVRHRPRRPDPQPPRPAVRRSPASRPASRPAIVAIGASTGGPSALEKVLSGLPGDFAAPVVVVQHIAEGFDRGLVDWLNRSTSLDVRLGVSDLPLRAGQVVIAPCRTHLTIVGRSVVLERGALLDGHRPSITRLFSSVAESFGSRAVGVILTGMGADGARGLLDLKRAGGLTFAQDEATSIVYGMAREAVNLGAADQILPLGEISHALVEALRVPSGSA